MSGFIFVPIVRVRNVVFLAIVRNVVCTNCRGAALTVSQKFSHKTTLVNTPQSFYIPNRGLQTN